MDTLVIVSLLMVSLSAMAEEELEPSLDGFLVYPVSPTVNVRKRETASIEKKESKDSKGSNNKQFEKFALDKLLEHNQALETLLTKMQATEEMTKRLINNYGKQPQQPKLPEKFEFDVPDKQNELDHPVVKLGKNLPIYGNLVKSMVLQNVQEDVDPVALVEHDPNSNSTLVKSSPLMSSRRSFGGGGPGPEIDVPQGVSPWCLVATLCKKNGIPVCGFDDRFGYGKFDDFCHMLQVNCYYKYNFAVVANCKPFFS